MPIPSGGVSDVDELTKRVTSLGTLIRAGVKTDSAAAAAGLPNLSFHEGLPLTWRPEGEVP